MTTTKYPNISIPLAGEDGNAFSILARCRRAMTRAGLGNDEVEAFTAEATSGNYDHLLTTVIRWFSVEDFTELLDEDDYDDDDYEDEDEGDDE